MTTNKKTKNSSRATPQVKVRDLKPTGDAKGGGRKQEANFLPGDIDPNGQKKEADGL
ncbi:MAG: hypothetical protein M3Y86_12270 [Verrucomicrobiota bacterium]|nr:hypothetical protein [Verrucomicrobiota bacterium]